MHPVEAAALGELVNAEIQEVEQTSDETNSVKGITETEIQRVEQNSEADSVKGKEVTTTKRRTKPPLNFIAFLNDAKKNSDIDISILEDPDKLRDLLYAGVFLEPKKLKYFVDEKFNKNCFVVFARKLDICWSDNSQYWNWTEEKDTSGEDIEVAELLRVCWLDIQGKIQTMNLSLRTVYEVVFVVKIKDKYQHNIWEDSETLTIILPHSKTLTRLENLSKKPSGNWIEIQVGEFEMSPENVGEMTFKLEQHSTNWKSGLLVKCAIIRPKN
ncbi:uncharacterized protein PHLOEM PROTEIN 2-LIKE A4-like [Quercus lobata]|uniref:Uncharacterized protein n=1 Tax=Quercus lobata TaxID=97700 RepID=A0A7N2MU80_QUELO|nr:uncharacterized protein PHLOEM PROTEIN 2-LIKE A4-like [Quercus lobata]